MKIGNLGQSFRPYRLNGADSKTCTDSGRNGPGIVSPRASSERETSFPHDLARITIAYMNYDYLRELLDKRPFEPFTVQLSSGETHSVRYPSCAALTRTRLAIADPDADRIVVCSLLHIVSIEMLQTAA